jgi:hypothetical protein
VSKTLDRDTYLKTLALFTMANRKYLDGDQFMRELARLLGMPEGDLGAISDAIFEERPDFDRALEREGFTLATSDEGQPRGPEEG